MARFVICEKFKSRPRNEIKLKKKNKWMSEKADKLSGDDIPPRARYRYIRASAGDDCTPLNASRYFCRAKILARGGREKILREVEQGDVFQSSRARPMREVSKKY